MANKLISQLGATAGVVATDVFEIEKLAGPPSQKATITQLTTLLSTIYAPITGGAYVLKAGDTMTGLLTIAQATANTSAFASTGYSLTGANAQSLMSLAGTWNTSGNPVALRLAITNTAAGGTAKFIECLGGAAGATSLFNVDAGGITTVAALTIGSASDLLLVRDGSATLAQRNSTIAQVFRVYRTFTNSTNYERLALQTAAGQMIVAAETAGTGTDDLDLVLTPAGVGRVTLPGGAQLLKTTAAMTSGPGVALGTLTDAPSAGNADVWCPIMFNGVQYWFPCWSL